jgi:hypothetical protein
MFNDSFRNIESFEINRIDAKGIMGESRYSELDYHCSLMRQNEAVHLVCLVDLVCFVYLVDLVHLVSFAQPKKPDKPNRPDRPNEPASSAIAAANPLLAFHENLPGNCFATAVASVSAMT